MHEKPSVQIWCSLILTHTHTHTHTQRHTKSILWCELKYASRTEFLLYSLISRGWKTTSVSSAVSAFHHSSVQSSSLAKMMLVGTKQCPAENTDTILQYIYSHTHAHSATHTAQGHSQTLCIIIVHCCMSLLLQAF